MTKKTLSLLLYFLLLSKVLISQSQPPESFIKNTRLALTTEITKLLKESGIPSISIALINKDSIIWAEAFGFANVKKEVEATSSTIYSTGSTFKFVTATAIMQLAEDKKLNIDDPINNYLEDFQISDFTPNGTPVSFRHLLSHHSGLEGFIEIVPVWDRKIPRKLEEIPLEVRATGLPGKDYKYCNHCYALAGLIIEKVSNQSFEEYIVENILKPLQIKTTGPITPTPEMVEELALPYSLQQGIPVPQHQSRFDVYPAGDAYLTSTEMAKFLIAQMNNGRYKEHSILSPSSTAEMQSPHYNSNYGLGTRVKTNGNLKFLEHTGSVPGFSTFFKIETNTKVGVYIASNADEVQDHLKKIANFAIELMYNTL